MSRHGYEDFKEAVLDVLHDHMAFHETLPTRQLVVEDAGGGSSGHRYAWLDRMRRERLIRYVESHNHGTLVALREEQ